MDKTCSGICHLLTSTKYLYDKIDTVNGCKKTFLYFPNILLLCKKLGILGIIEIILEISVYLKYPLKTHDLRLAIIYAVNINSVGILKSCLLVEDVDYVLYLGVTGTLLNINTETLTILVTSVGNIYNRRKLSVSGKFCHCIKEFGCSAYHGYRKLCHTDTLSSVADISYLNLTSYLKSSKTCLINSQKIIS